MADLTILQSVKTWLPRTQKWLHRQITDLPASFDIRVACRETFNLDAFPISPIEAFDERDVSFPPGNWLLDIGRDIPGVRDAVDQWELRRWVVWRSQIGDGADIVHSHFGQIGWRDVGVARRLDAHHVTTFYGYDCSLLPTRQPKWRRRYPELFEHVDSVLCEGPHMKRTVADLGCPPEKITVHHLGVDADAIPFRERTRQTDDEPVEFMIASSFKPKKGIPDAIEALGRLAEDIDFRLTLVGDATGIERSAEEKRRIEAAIDDHGLEDRIRRPGFLDYDELIETMLDHDVLIAPSRRSERGDSEGGAPVTLIAAHATGMPIVSTTHADIPNVVLNDETGYLSPERDTDALTANLARIVRNADRWPEMGRRARERVEAEFNTNIQSQRLADHYRSLVDSP